MEFIPEMDFKNMKNYIVNRIVILVLAAIIIPIPVYSATVQYEYDDLNRLVMITYDNVSTLEYSYDDVGNRFTKTIINVIFKGDINNNETIDLYDAILALRISAGGTPGNIWSDADTNDNGKIGIEDAVYILQTIAGL